MNNSLLSSYTQAIFKFSLSLSLSLSLYFGHALAAGRILVPQPGIEPMTPALTNSAES